MNNDQRIKLLNKRGELFEEISIPPGKHDAILFANRVFLPGKNGVWKEANFYPAPLPPMKPLTGT
jgi:hypothetical protein